MEQIKEANVLEQYSSSMGVYGIEVTLRRVVPDWRDGLKLVQRRILLSMLSKGCDKIFAKPSKIVPMLCFFSLLQNTTKIAPITAKIGVKEVGFSI